ncbi:metallophosphoesterase [Clostridium sartagoforme AAU1]|uniref:Metallophosphoesterase n=1 Tax=Clostridium sartagoforme AAU1 TaxID=1202534 RepID=R9BYZ3_9CLOT|nr:lamin tail domain-containing protein [Clostridium sartagoforme]EOR20196.1 metallophosphoesterase [Clostridium sartagoforme AAU1]
MIRKKLYKSKLLSLGLTTLMLAKPMEVMAASTKTLLATEYIAEENVKINEIQIPELLITEILPDSKNVNGSDAYEFIEVYNNSDVELNLNDYKLYYNYPDNGDASDTLWVDINKDIKIQPKATIVFG